MQHIVDRMNHPLPSACTTQGFQLALLVLTHTRVWYMAVQVGGGSLHLKPTSGKPRIVVVYRGTFCPFCRVGKALTCKWRAIVCPASCGQQPVVEW